MQILTAGKNQANTGGPEAFSNTKVTPERHCSSTCCGGVGMVGLLGQVEDLFAGVGRRNCVLPLSCLYWVILLPIIVSIIELLKPLDKIQVVLETPFH